MSGKRASREGAAELRLSPISACAGPVSRGRAAAQAGAGKRRVFPPPSLPPSLGGVLSSQASRLHLPWATLGGFTPFLPALVAGCTRTRPGLSWRHWNEEGAEVLAWWLPSCSVSLRIFFPFLLDERDDHESRKTSQAPSTSAHRWQGV